MITFIAYILTIIGCINWLLVGLLQYDFIAGLFGFQASIFSRIFYILFGIASVYLTIRVIANKGTFKIYEKRKKKEKEQVNQPNTTPSYANVEAGQENVKNKQNYQSEEMKPETNKEGQENNNGLFDEHIKKH